jgi:DNA-directed RNA polymerase specialized sigma24 family protein
MGEHQAARASSATSTLDAEFTRLHGRYHRAITRYLSKALHRDDASQEAALLLWQMLLTWDPDRNPNLDGYIGACWRRAATGILTRELERTQALTWGEPSDAALTERSVEEQYLDLISARDARARVRSLDVAAADLDAALAYHERAGTWRGGGRTDREILTRGHLAADAYNAHGIHLTPLQAAAKVNSLIRQQRKEHPCSRTARSAA